MFECVMYVQVPDLSRFLRDQEKRVRTGMAGEDMFYILFFQHNDFLLLFFEFKSLDPVKREWWLYPSYTLRGNDMIIFTIYSEQD